MSTLQGPSKLICGDGARAPAEAIAASNTAAATGPCQINLFDNITALLTTRDVRSGSRQRDNSARAKPVPLNSNCLTRVIDWRNRRHICMNISRDEEPFGWSLFGPKTFDL